MGWGVVSSFHLNCQSLYVRFQCEKTVGDNHPVLVLPGQRVLLVVCIRKQLELLIVTNLHPLLFGCYAIMSKGLPLSPK